jgi:hypothetical protein
MKASPKPFDFEICRFYVAGVGYGDYSKMNLTVGSKLELFGETNNKHDTAAISLRQGAWRLGYVPRGELQPILWQLHRKGFKMKAFVVNINANNPTWEMYCVKVCTQVDPEKENPKRLIKF